MGVFSWTCAKTHLPVLNDMLGADPGMCTVVVLYRDGSLIRGTYNGYGQVASTFVADALDSGEAKWVLEAFFDRATDSFETLGKSGDDPGQGHFYPAEVLQEWHSKGGFSTYDAFHEAYWKMVHMRP